MNRFYKVGGMMALLLLPAGIALAEEPMTMPPAPTVPTSLIMMIMLSLTLDVLLIIAVAYIWMMWRQDHQALKQVSALSAEMKELSKALKGLQPPEPEELPVEEIPLPKPEALGPVIKKEVVWKPFVEDFNKFAEGMKKPGAEGACEKFVKEKKLKLLMCLDHAAVENGLPSPKFTEVQSVAVSGFWAYPLPDVADRYAIVPNPLIPYEQKIHEEGGMKETFASNFESGVCRTIIVKMPALMHYDGGRWITDQPGMIRVEP